MSKMVLLSLDQGTTSTRALVFSVDGAVLFVQQKELNLIIPYKGWVEQDAEQIWEDVVFCLGAAVNFARENGFEIAGLGITNQRETTVVWDRETGAPIYNAIVWQDRRTADVCTDLRAQGHEDVVSEKTGLLLDPYFSATKIAWILDHVEGARERAGRGELAFGTIESYVLWRLTGGAVHKSDMSNASRTMLYDIREQRWDEELLRLFDVPAALLPEVEENVAVFGVTDLFGESIVIGGMAGDQQAALIGQACFDVGMVKSTYGTGCFALVNIGTEFRVSRNRLLTTVAYAIGGEVHYAIEGSIFVAGAAVQWLRDGLELFDEAGASEALALSVADNGGVYMVPAFTGLGAPYWKADATGMLHGLTRDTSKAHVVRAVLEAQGFQTRDLMDAMENDAGVEIGVLRADGGLVANEFVCQFLADILDKDVEVPAVVEATAWGAACLAGLQVGVFSGLDDIAARWHAARCYAPDMEEAQREVLCAGWADAVKRVLI